MSDSQIPEIAFNDMTLCAEQSAVLNSDQLNFILKKTPEKHVYRRVAKGGGQWNYVTGVYVKKVLNLVFGFNWSFEVVEHKIDLQLKQAYVLGKLTVHSNGQSIVKMQFGRVDIKFRKNPDPETKMRLPLDVGNDLKAATTDALKKCAAELGIASDVYAPNEFKEIRVSNDRKDEVAMLTEKDVKLAIGRIIVITKIADLSTFYNSDVRYKTNKEICDALEAKRQELQIDEYENVN